MELSSSNIKIFHTFSRKKAVLIFQETKTPKKLLIFQETELFLHFGKRKPRKNYLYFWKRNFLIFQEETFRARKVKQKHS